MEPVHSSIHLLFLLGVFQGLSVTFVQAILKTSPGKGIDLRLSLLQEQ